MDNSKVYGVLSLVCMLLYLILKDSYDWADGFIFAQIAFMVCQFFEMATKKE